ncbi:bromodomain associated [Dictyocaulus viviparus]|uniref:Bromodomain associated n=1 Tax=Dictyocaulus viviparus TaxID=29172 RepID=A0A0D8XL28_DICVI|nr:bromodomain associated [Dictyocaulus viviparus]
MGSWPSPEEVARQGLSTATSLILENIGFSTVSGESLNALTDIMRRFMIGLWSRSKLLAEHAGRTDICPDDMDQTFRKLKFSPMEMRDYLLQVGNVGQPKSICRFPVASPNVRPLFAPRPSAKELEDRAEHIPFYYPAVHPEWTAEGADYLAVMKPSTSTERKGGPADFPDFSNCDAKSIGLLRRGFEGPSFLDTSKDHSSATGKPKNIFLSWKDHSKCSPSPSPSPSSAQLFKRFEQSSCRSEVKFGFFISPSRLTVTLPRKQDQKQLKAITGKAKKVRKYCAVMPKVESPSSSPMPTLENQSVASVNVTASVDGDSVKKSPSIR